MEKQKVIIDCDPGIDDALALMLACASEELDILGITITSGNVNGIQGVENALQVLKRMNRLDIPVYLGATVPLKRDLVTAEETHGHDGLGEICLPPVKESRWQENAARFMENILLQEDTVSVIALGPLTNIATLIATSPKAASKIKELVLMGGSYRSHGNCSPVAEFNFWADPDAAEYVFAHLGRPITMVGLDVTRQIVLTPDYRELLHQLQDDRADFIVDITRFYTDFHWQQEKTLGCVINDPLAVAYFIDRHLCKGFDAYVDIVTEGKAIGMSMVDVQGITGKKHNCHVLTAVNSHDFMAMFLTRLFPDKKDCILSVLKHSQNNSAGVIF